MFNNKKNNVQSEKSVQTEKKTEVIEKKEVVTGDGFYKIVKTATIHPKKSGDAGFDLSLVSAESIEKHNGRVRKLATTQNGELEIFPNTVYRGHTGLAANLPEGYFGLIKPRSGLSASNGLDVLAGVVDNTYTGELIIVFTVEVPMVLKIGERMAQMVLIPHFDGKMGEVTELKTTERNSNGFGSSGK